MLTDAIREALTARRWAPTTPFSARLCELRRLLQERFNRVPADGPFVSRVPTVLHLPPHDLAHLLPPSERRPLAHLRARQPLRPLLGTPGFHSTSRVEHPLQ